MPVIHSFKPNPIPAGKYQRMIDPSTLTKQQNRLLWEGIKKDDPALAELLTQDENLKQLKAQFGASIRFSVADFNRFIQTGQKVLEEKASEKS